MADETKTQARAAAEAPAKVADAVVATAAKVAEQDAKALRNARDRARRAAKKAEAGARATRTKTRGAKTRRTTRTTRTAQPKQAAARIERIADVTFDPAKIFNGFAAVPGAEPFQALFADASERSQEMVRRSQKAAEDLVEIARANVEALTEAGRIAATGARSLGQDALASGRDGIEKASAAVKTLADAKSPTEFFQIQSEIARASFDRAVAEGSKFTEQLVKLAGEAVQPLSTRASLNAERMNEIAA